MNTTLELVGVALAALLSENMVLVSCMGIGTHRESFQSPREAIRTGSCLTVVMVFGVLLALIFALCGGVGATLALASFASLQKEVDLNRCPRVFRGVPIQLITAGLMAMALVGYYGLYLE